MQKAMIVALLACALSAYAQQDFSKVEIKVEKVAGTVYMLTGQGGNIGVCVGEDGIVLVDDQYAGLAPKIISALNGISDKPIRFIINTHYHGDHTGGNEIFARSGTIIAQENVRKRLQSGTRVGTRETPPAPKIALPVITFNDRAAVHVNGEDIRAVHYPTGHTDGDAVIEFVQSNVVHMGDDFFNGIFPVIDIANGGSARGMLQNVESVLKIMRDDAKVIPGHGPLGDKAALRAFADMLRGTIDTVAAAVKAGKTLDQMKQEKVLAAWDKWGWTFIPTDRYLEVLYSDLSRK
jgi:glyoxylase-like metal-dependent hydrolase (beta-lactamase superfamily II)